ncbi:MAG: hypothetical protein AAFY10_08675 [Pseudomonadota bacterium]
MMMLFGSLARASTKLALSFVLVIVIMVLAFAFAPGLVRGLQDIIEGINDMIRTPPILSDQGLILYRTLVNEATIFGILLTLLSRAIIEVCAFAFGQGMKAARGGSGSVA